MGCGCQDKERDAAILDYYNKKKSMMEQASIVENLMRVRWEGSIDLYKIYVGSEDLIRSIERIDNGWEAIVIVI